MKKNMMKQMYMKYVSEMKKSRKEQIDIPTDQIKSAKKVKK